MCTGTSMSFNLKIVFTSDVRVKSFFTFKDKSPKMWRSEFAYNCNYDDCNITYYVETKHPFEVQTYEHLDILHFIGKKVKTYNNMLRAI